MRRIRIVRWSDVDFSSKRIRLWTQKREGGNQERHKNPNTTTRYLRTIGLEDTRSALEEGFKMPGKVIEFPKAVNGLKKDPQRWRLRRSCVRGVKLNCNYLK